MGKSKTVTHRFFCMNCGEEGVSLPRKLNKLKKGYHRKRMFCIHCQKEVNFIECRDDWEVENFKLDFNEGLFKEEAQASIEFIENEKGVN